MASSKPTLNPLTDTPTNKTQVTKPFMLAYMKSEKATNDDREWFKKVVADPKNQAEKKNPLNGEVYIDIDIPVIRKLFIDRFYPQLNAKKKAKSFIDEIMDL